VKKVWNDGCLRDLAARWDARASCIEMAAEDQTFEAARASVRRAAAMRVCAQELRALVRKLLIDAGDEKPAEWSQENIDFFMSNISMFY
jgi:hypothetical protein